MNSTRVASTGWLVRRVGWFARACWWPRSSCSLGLNLLPGDVAGVILGPNASQQSIDALREQLGLNQNIVPRYVEWLGAMLTGDLGRRH